MPLLTVATEQKQYEFNTGKSLMDIMLDAGLFIDNACGGKGLCGKCRVRITGGEPGEITETESRILKDEEKEQGIRLACLVFPESDLTIELLQKEKKHDVLASGYMPDFDFDLEYYINLSILLLHPYSFLEYSYLYLAQIQHY